MERESEGENEGHRSGAKSRKAIIRRHTDLEVYQRAFAVAMKIFELTKNFPQKIGISKIDYCRRLISLSLHRI
jgi:hypothetical protein